MNSKTNPFVSMAHAFKIAELVLASFETDESGFTVDPFSGMLVKSVCRPTYFYALVNLGCVTRTAPSFDDVYLWLIQNWHFIATQGCFVGGWTHKGKFYLDVSICETDRARAIALGMQNKQIAIYDMAEDQDIMLQLQNSWIQAFFTFLRCKMQMVRG